MMTFSSVGGDVRLMSSTIGGGGGVSNGKPKSAQNYNKHKCK